MAPCVIGSLVVRAGGTCRCREVSLALCLSSVTQVTLQPPSPEPLVGFSGCLPHGASSWTTLVSVGTRQGLQLKGYAALFWRGWSGHTYLWWAWPVVAALPTLAVSLCSSHLVLPQRRPSPCLHLRGAALLFRALPREAPSLCFLPGAPWRNFHSSLSRIP